MSGLTDGVVAWWTLFLGLLDRWQVVAWLAYLFGAWLAATHARTIAGLDEWSREAGA